MPCLPAAAAAGDHSGAIWLWDPATGKPLGQCRVGGWVRESGRAGGWGGGSARYSSLTARTTHLPPTYTHPPAHLCPQGHRKFITSLAWEPAHAELPARRFVSGSKDATLKVWEATTRCGGGTCLNAGRLCLPAGGRCCG